MARKNDPRLEPWMEKAREVIRGSERTNGVKPGNISGVEADESGFVTFVYTLPRELGDGVKARVCMGHLDLSPTDARFEVNSLDYIEQDGSTFRYVDKILNPFGIYVPGDPSGGMPTPISGEKTRAEIVRSYAAEKGLALRGELYGRGKHKCWRTFERT